MTPPTGHIRASGAGTPPIPWLAVGLISAAALAYELLLTRIFSMVHWHHLVGMVISLALLGYGASGTFLTLVGDRLRRHFSALFMANALLFTVTAGLAVWVIRLVPLNPLELPWDPRQPVYLTAVYAAAALPFLGAANCIGMALSVFPGHGHRIYAVDLAAAGVGVAAITALFWIWPPGEVLWLVCATGLAAALAGGRETGMGGRALLAAGTLGLVAVPATLGPLEITPATYKDLHRARATLGARTELEKPGPMGVITVVANDKVPYRHAPGLSLGHAGPPAGQRALFVDGEGAGALIPVVDGLPPEFVRHRLSALPYRLVAAPRVLVLGLAGNGSLLQALAHGAIRIAAVEPDPNLVQLLADTYADLTGDLLSLPGVTAAVSHPRTLAQGSRESFDVVVADLGNAGNVGGLRSQKAGYTFTTEALVAYLGHLRPGGLVAISGQLQRPPRESLKLAATARDALRARGTDHPARHLAMIRDWQRFTLVVTRRPLSPSAVEAVRRFADDHGFDLVALPGMGRQEANRRHRLESPRYHDGVARLLGPRAADFEREYPFRITPATDDRPFFHRFSRWHNLPELLSLPAGTGFAQLDWGYWMTVAALAQALVLAALFILAPLLVLGRSSASTGLKAATVAYFAAVGLAFLFVEIAFIQRLQLLLGHPVYATAVVLAGFLAWAGLGSYLSRRRLEKGRPHAIRRRLAVAVGIIGVTAVLYLVLLPPLTAAAMGWPFAGRLLLSLGLIAPLALAMGMPFPLGLAVVESRAADLVPWAWGINGSASVVSSLAATLLAMDIGFSGLVLVAVALYLPLPWIFRTSVS